MTPKARLLLIALCLVAAAIGFALWFSSRNSKNTGAARADKAAPAAAPVANDSSRSNAPPSSEPAADKLTDFRRALEEARALRDPKLHAREFGRILRAWMERDPEAALAYVRGLPAASADSTQGILMLLEAIGRRDPGRALTLARELAVTREELAIYSSLFAQLAQQDVHLAAQRLSEVPTGAARENAVRALTDAWVRTDLSSALTWAQNLSDAADRAIATEVVLAEMAGKDPLQAIDLAQKSLTGAALERTVFNALEKLAESDPRGASGLVQLLPPGEMQTLAAVDVARALAAQNVDAALAWAKTLRGDAVRSLATKRTLEIWASTDLTAAGRYVAALPAGREQNDAAAVLAVPLAVANPANALAWAQSLPSADARPIALAAIVDTWAQHDPVSATHWAAEQPASTLGALAPQTLNASLSYWVLQDSGAAQAFVRTLPAEIQGGAAEFLAPLLSQQDPAAALTWAQSLSVARAREAAIAAAYSRWHDNAPSEAAAWLAKANLAPETKARLQTVR